MAYLAARSPRAAAALLQVVENSVSALAAFNSGRIGRAKGTFEKVLRRYPYIVQYEIIGEEVRILAIVHGARLWPEGEPPPE